MENPSHYLESTKKNNKRRGREGGNTTSGNLSAQETKNGPRKDNKNRQRAKEDRDLEGEEGEYTSSQGAVATGQSHARDRNKYQHTRTKGK
jgi:hypothetical protein